MTNCPCCSGKTYQNCCEPIIKAQTAKSALALMRSRYTAYHLGNAQYLYQTTHPDYRTNYNINEIANWSNENQWNKLEIVSVEHGNVNDTRGIVEFKAYYQNKNGLEQIHHERSDFEKNDGQWYYTKGIVDPKPVAATKKVSRNDPCPCGSGKKHKKCCLVTS